MNLKPKFATALLLITLSFLVTGQAIGVVPPFIADPNPSLDLLERSGDIAIFPTGEPWQSYRYATTGLSGIAIGKPIPLASGNDDEALKVAVRRVIPEVSARFGFAFDSYEIAQILHGKSTTTVLIYFYEESHEIYGAHAVLTFDDNGSLVSLKGRGYENKLAGSFTISTDELAARTMGLKEFVGTSLKSSSYVWYPVKDEDGFTLQAACEVTLSHSNPSIRPVIFINATDGSILHQENRVVYENMPGTAQGLYRPFRPGDRPVTGPFRDEIVTLNGAQAIYTNIDGSFRYEVNPGAAPFRIRSELRGRWVDVEYEDGPDAAFNRLYDRVEQVTIDWTRDNSRDDERMLYYHTNLIHAFWKALDPNFRGMDRVLPAVCEYGDNYENAFWNGQGMYFGNSAALGNLAMKGDVIHHEFGHGVTGSIYPWNVLPYEGESGALNEAWSDYFPCTISNESHMGENSIGGAGAMRNIDNNLVYPRDWFGEVHYDSRIISAAMWHTREQLGNDASNEIFHFARFNLGNTFLTYFTDVLITDDNDDDITNGTPNDLILYEQFGRHGIGPGIFPKIDFTHVDISDENQGDGDMIWEAGETVEIEVGAFRAGSLYPPPAQNVRVRVACDHSSIALLNAEVALGTMSVDDTLSAQEALSFSIAQDAPISFATLYVSIEADRYGTITTDTIRIALGLPSLLLVRDDAGSTDRSDWYRRSLDELQVVYSEYQVGSANIAFDEWMLMFNNIIWFTGDTAEGFLSAPDQGRIASFIADGGNIVLSGQSIAGQMAGNGFLEANFGATLVTDSLNQFLIEGVQGDPVGRGMSLLALGSHGAMNQRRPAAIAAVDDGVECFQWARLPERPAAGVRMEHSDSGAKTLFLSFGVEGIGGHGGTNTREHLLISVLDWFGVEHNVEANDPVPTSLEIGMPYPNPFNSSVSVPFTAIKAGQALFHLYDVSGRTIANGTIEAASGRNVLSFNSVGWGSGYYLLTVKSGEMTATRGMLLLK